MTPTDDQYGPSNDLLPYTGGDLLALAALAVVIFALGVLLWRAKP